MPLVLASGALLLASVFASRAASRIGVPALLLFLAVGMLAGSDGPGGIPFDNPPLAQGLGVVALAFILFGGGLDTQWGEVRPVAGPAVALATLGVLVTAGLTGWFASWLLGIRLLEGLLLGAIVSSTDAAAVFAVLRSGSVRLPARLKSLLELESGSNDPMAVFLTVGLIALIQDAHQTPLRLLVSFFLQMTIGTLSGYALGRAGAAVVNRARLEYEGLYPVVTVALVLLAYGITDVIGGSGFLAVYVAGIVMRRVDFIHKRSLIKFHDAAAWLMQIAMFLTLGLQVFPSRLGGVAVAGTAVAFFLMLVARPLGVFPVLALGRFAPREQALVAWVGLRGAVPIILATFPLVARVPAAEESFTSCSSSCSSRPSCRERQSPSWRACSGWPRRRRRGPPILSIWWRPATASSWTSAWRPRRASWADASWSSTCRSRPSSSSSSARGTPSSPPAGR